MNSYHVDSTLTLKINSIFHDIDNNLATILAQNSVIITLNNKKSDDGEFQVENKIYIVLQGRAFLSCINSNGKKIILEDLNEGTIFGDLDFLNHKPYSDDCLFVEPYPKNTVKLLEFDKNIFLNTLSSNLSLSLYILSSISRQNNQLKEKIEELAFFNLRHRIILELVKLGEIDNNNKNLVRIPVKITHEKLSQVIGSVRERVSKVLKQLQKEKIVVVDENKNFIIDLSRL